MLYSRIHDTTPTRKSRTLKKARYVYGDGDAKDRYVYCQYCGFICDTKRDVLQPTSGVSVSPSDITEGVIRCQSNIEWGVIRCEDGSILMEESTSLSLIVEQYYDYDDAILMEEDTNLPLIIEQYFSYEDALGCEDGVSLADETGEPLGVVYMLKTDFYYQYKPIVLYTVTHNCPFCGGQYTL